MPTGEATRIEGAFGGDPTLIDGAPRAGGFGGESTLIDGTCGEPTLIEGTPRGGGFGGEPTEMVGTAGTRDRGDLGGEPMLICGTVGAGDRGGEPMLMWGTFGVASPTLMTGMSDVTIVGTWGNPTGVIGVRGEADPFDVGLRDPEPTLMPAMCRASSSGPSSAIGEGDLRPFGRLIPAAAVIAPRSKL